MSTKTAVATLVGDGLRFEVRAGSGHTLVLDDGAGDAGPRPAELVPAALAACTAMDVISILRKKRQDVSRYEVHAEGEQSDGWPHEFRSVTVTHHLQGPALNAEAVRRSIELSATRYCSVGATLASGVTDVHHRYVVTSDDARHEGEVLVAGPHRDPREPAGPVLPSAVGAGT